MSVRALSKYQVALVTLVSLALAFLWSQQPVLAENPETIRPSRNFVVTDDANILTPASKNHIIDQDRQFKNTKQQPQVAVLTVDNTDGLDMKEFTNQLTQRRIWQAGKNGQDNGVIIVFAKNNGQNNVRIAPGSGVESALPDGKTIVMLENQRDQLKSKDPDQVNQGLMAIFDQVAAQLPTTAAASSKSRNLQHSPYLLPLVVLIALVVSFGILILWSHRVTRRGTNTGTGRRPGNPAGYSGYGGPGFFHGFLLGPFLSALDHRDHDDDDDDWPPGGGSGFSGGGDFGGGSDFSDSAGGGDFGGGGSDI